MMCLECICFDFLVWSTFSTANTCIVVQYIDISDITHSSMLEEDYFETEFDALYHNQTYFFPPQVFALYYIQMQDVH